MADLKCGIFSCPDTTAVGATIYSSNYYHYVVRLDENGEKQLVREPAEFDREGRPNR